MWIITAIFAIFVAFMQSTISPSLAIYSGILDLLLVVILIFLFYGSVRQACFFLLISAIVLSTLSGVPLVYIILPNFLLIVGYLLLSSKRIISRPTTLVSLPIILLSSVFVGFVKILIMQRLSTLLIVPIISGSVLTMLVGGAAYYFCNKAYYFLNPQLLREKIKISRM